MDRHDLAERVAALEATLNGKSGVIDKLDHLDQCVDALKITVWKATGALAVIVVISQWALRHI